MAHLVGSEGGIMRAVGACSLLLGFAFYIGYSVMYMTWIDLGVYSVSITWLHLALLSTLQAEHYLVMKPSCDQ